MRSSKNHKGCCPFHGEKTPSFYVYDDRFHCYGCGAHGDVITFVMKTAGTGFLEAVEDLARQAGLEVPKASPQAAEAEQKRAGISKVLEAAAKIYQKWLFEPQGGAALEYLHKRGLTSETIQKFGLGWCGEGRGVLAGVLRGQGIKQEQLIEAGLMKQGDFGPVDMFFSRVMFPIQDRRGSLISFGRRILGDGQPKYVNGPETVVFSKRRSLYGLNLAREAVRKGAKLLVVEGYMDVIALAQAGFTGAVAPLGTALTEEHLTEIWRLSPEPVMCFDGDDAGRRAALKTADLAVGALAPDRSLKFLSLPEKDDPDSLVRKEGAVAFSARLETARPLSGALYDMLAENTTRATPETRAAFRQRLIDTANRIPDTILAGEYRTMLLNRFFEERKGNIPRKARATSGYVRASSKPNGAGAELRRGRLMLATLIAHPALIHDVEEAFAHVALPETESQIRSALSSFVNITKSLDSNSLLTHLTDLGLGEAAKRITAEAAKDYRPDSDTSPAQIAETWWSWYILMDSSIEMLRSQRGEAQNFWQAHQDDPAAWNRLIKYNELLRRAVSGEAAVEEN